MRDLAAGMPVVLLLLFVNVFGGTLGAGLGDLSGGRGDYANYVTPGIMLVTVAAAAQGTAISVAMDMTEGIIARFRAMAIARVSVLTGHVLGAMFLMLLPFLGSGLVPTDSMPAGLRWFADYQPFTPVMETLRGLLMGTPMHHHSAVLAIAWCSGIGLLGYLWAKRLFNRDPTP